MAAPARLPGMNALQTRIAGYPTGQVHSLLRTLSDRSNLDDAHRMVHAALADELTRRWGVEAEVDEVFQDLDFDGSYVDALERARALKGERERAART